MADRVINAASPSKLIRTDQPLKATSGRDAIQRGPDWSGFAAVCRTNVAADLRSPVVVLRRQRLVSQSTRMIVVDHPVQR